MGKIVKNASSIFRYIGMLGLTVLCLAACGQERSQPAPSSVNQRSQVPFPPRSNEVNPLPLSPFQTSSPTLLEVFTVVPNADPDLGNLVLRDPRGLMWGSIVLGDDGEALRLTDTDANEYCLSLNPLLERDEIEEALANDELPSRGYFLPRRQNIENLRVSMGAQAGTPLNTLPIGFHSQQIFGNETIWIAPLSTEGRSVIFNSEFGSLVESEPGDLNTFRCVAVRAWVEQPEEHDID